MEDLYPQILSLAVWILDIVFGDIYSGPSVWQHKLWSRQGNLMERFCCHTSNMPINNDLLFVLWTPSDGQDWISELYLIGMERQWHAFGVNLHLIPNPKFCGTDLTICNQVFAILHHPLHFHQNLLFPANLFALELFGADAFERLLWPPLLPPFLRPRDHLLCYLPQHPCKRAHRLWGNWPHRFFCHRPAYLSRRLWLWQLRQEQRLWHPYLAGLVSSDDRGQCGLHELHHRGGEPVLRELHAVDDGAVV